MMAVTMILILVLSSTVMAYAEVEPRETGVINFTIERASRTTAIVTVDFIFTAHPDLYNVKVYLQKNVNGSWVSDVNNPDYFFGFSGEDSILYSFNHIYSHLEADINYRLKCVSTDYIGSNHYSTTTYSNQF